MKRSKWDELDEPEAGKLEEGPDAIARMITGGHRRGAEVYVLFRSRPLPPHVSRTPKFDKDGVRIGDPAFAKFSYIRRPYVEGPIPPSVRAGKRVILYAASNAGKAIIKAAQAKRHGTYNGYTIPKELMTPELAKFAGPEARARFIRIVNRRAAPPSAAARYQRYIDGPIAGKTSKSAVRIEEVDGVPSLLGNIGTGRVERAKSWTEFVAGMDRANARFQYRILLPLPASFTPAERRAAVEEFARRLFEPYGIRWSAAIHKPVPKSTTDEGTWHAHIPFEPLGTDKMRELKKNGDRVYLQLGWPETIKKVAAEAFNDVYWRSERRIGLEKGTPVFGVTEAPRGEKSPGVKEASGEKRAPNENPRQWRLDEKRREAGLPTVSQRKALLEDSSLPAWMSIDSFLPALEAIPGLLTALVPTRQPHDPTIEKALGHLRAWAEKLIELILEEVRQTFEVATYLSLPLCTEPSELLRQVFEQFRGVDWQRSPERFAYPNGYRSLQHEKWRKGRFAGQIAREMAETIAAIEEVEGRDFFKIGYIGFERSQLAAYHKLMTRALLARQPAMEALTNTIQYFESLTPQKSAESYEWWPFASMAADGIGAVLMSKENERVVFFEEFGLPRKTILEDNRDLKFPVYQNGQDDPWLKGMSEGQATRIRDLWRSAVARGRQLDQAKELEMRKERAHQSASLNPPVRPPKWHRSSALPSQSAGGAASTGQTANSATRANVASQSQAVSSNYLAANRSSDAETRTTAQNLSPGTRAASEPGISVADAIAANRRKFIKKDQQI